MPATYARGPGLGFFYWRYKSIIFYVLLIYEVEFYAIHLAGGKTRGDIEKLYFHISERPLFVFPFQADLGPVGDGFKGRLPLGKNTEKDAADFLVP